VLPAGVIRKHTGSRLPDILRVGAPACARTGAASGLPGSLRQRVAWPGWSLRHQPVSPWGYGLAGAAGGLPGCPVAWTGGSVARQSRSDPATAPGCPQVPPAEAPIQRGQNAQSPHLAALPSRRVAKLTRDDAVQPRNVCWRCARGQALCRDRLLLLGRPAAAALIARDQIHGQNQALNLESHVGAAQRRERTAPRCYYNLIFKIR
jgi:hypothetical protein